MFKFLMLQYRMHKITKERLKRYVPEYISAEQYRAITGEEYQDD